MARDFIEALTNESYREYVNRCNKDGIFTKEQIDDMWNEAYYFRRSQMLRKN